MLGLNLLGDGLRDVLDPQSEAAAMSLLEIERTDRSTIGGVPILQAASTFRSSQGEIVGLVGESGSGKSMTALTVMRLLPHRRQCLRHAFISMESTSSPPRKRPCAGLRGNDIGMVFQEPMTALNPVKTIGEQVAEGIRWHTGANRADAEGRARTMLDRVGLPENQFPLSRYPHELSGGQRQRVVIAIACALKPKLLIADEPTTALDVVLQAQILDLLRDLVDEDSMGLLLISHDLAVVADMSDRVTVMRHGEVMEEGETARTLSEQVHPYTRQLARGVDARAGAKGSCTRFAKPRRPAPANFCRRHPRLSRSPHIAVPSTRRAVSRRRRCVVSRSGPANPWRLSGGPVAENRPWRA